MTIMRQRHKNPVDKKSQNKGRQVKKTDDPKIHPFSFRSTKKKKKEKKNGEWTPRRATQKTQDKVVCHSVF